jgi:hypothetical protein
MLYACPVKLPEGNGLAGLTGALCDVALLFTVLAALAVAPLPVNNRIN